MTIHREDVSQGQKSRCPNDHRDWMGLAQPEGLVVTVAVLKAAGAEITWPVVDLQASLQTLASQEEGITDPRSVLSHVLGWPHDLLLEGGAIPDRLRVPLQDGEYLAPRFALRASDNPDDFALLVGQVEGRNTELDAATGDERWTATPHQKLERLLRETGVAVGLLIHPNAFRLVYAPKGESAGWLTFRVEALLSVDGRPLLGAFHMLLCGARVLSLEPDKRLIGLLRASREYQSTVSNALCEQVLSAFRELLRGFDAADRIAGGTLLGDWNDGHLHEVYLGLVTALMRMVFILFAEDRGLLPMEKELYATSYSLSRLYGQLLEDRCRYGEDTLDRRYGSWARVTTLFRILYDGVRASDGREAVILPERRGDLFDPDAFPFLEGRPRGSRRQPGIACALPRIPDGVLFRVLDQLLVLGGERLQYRGLDVEQIGSVYEALMGFRLERASGESLCLLPEHVVVDLEALLGLSSERRLQTLKAEAGLDINETVAIEVKKAATYEMLASALARRISPRQPGRIAKGSLYLQPGDERRKSGSHYTPKSLTSPIVENALRPIIDRLGPDATADQILELRICDPAMGSAAFLVETCRQLADQLVAAWRRTGTVPNLPPDEDLVLHARRLIAQRCLYGVDKNPLAVDLARLSLWLLTFARDHPFTFVDHSLRSGDSLVGFSRGQIAELLLEGSGGRKPDERVRAFVTQQMTRAEQLRRQIQTSGDTVGWQHLERLCKEADDCIRPVRMLGDLLVAGFFSANTAKGRKSAVEKLRDEVRDWVARGADLSELLDIRPDSAKEAVTRPPPLSWEIEFPEIFSGDNPGFDCIVGNPPFLGGKRISTVHGLAYRDWLSSLHEGASSNTDLAAHFFRRAFSLLKQGGTSGLIATKTIAQGDTRSSGLRWLCQHGAHIYAATRRVSWPGQATVVVSIVHFSKGSCPQPLILNGREVDRITAFLYARGGHDDPRPLRANAGKAFIGCFLRGKGFVFDDAKAESTPLREMHDILAREPESAEIVRPFVGGEEVLVRPTHHHDRYVIRFGVRDENEIQQWPSLARIVSDKVRPFRDALADTPVDRTHKRLWWRFANDRPELYAAIGTRTTVLVIPRVSQHLCAAFLPANMVFSDQLTIVPTAGFDTFAVLSSRVHNDWTRTFASTLGDGLRYTPSDCFETFPFPDDRECEASLYAAGKEYYEFRAATMITNEQGLTKTYNRFHDPQERTAAIERLRELHARMDRAVLDAYGWRDLQPVYDFRDQLDESIRLTWDETTQDEVLARLLEINRNRAARDTAQLPPTSKQKGSSRREASES